MRPVDLDRLVKYPLRVDESRDHYSIEWRLQLLITGHEWLSDELMRIDIGIDDGCDRDSAIDSRQDRDFGEIRFAAEHEVVEISLLCQRKGLRAIRARLPDPGHPDWSGLRSE